jgi:hypothetical protein
MKLSELSIWAEILISQIRDRGHVRRPGRRCPSLLKANPTRCVAEELVVSRVVVEKIVTLPAEKLIVENRRDITSIEIKDEQHFAANLSSIRCEMRQSDFD